MEKEDCQLNIYSMLSIRFIYWFWLELHIYYKKRLEGVITFPSVTFSKRYSSVNLMKIVCEFGSCMYVMVPPFLDITRYCELLFTNKS